MCVRFKIHVVELSHNAHLPITIGRDPWRHQLACANILPITPDADHPSRKGPDRGFPLFFIARESHTLCWMASRCTAARFEVQGIHP